MLKAKPKIIVSGSLAYDRIMYFPDRFKNHIMPDKIHILNLCFNVDKVQESFGGTAGNIAYNLSLLGEKAVVLALAGNDFAPYKKWLQKNKVDISYLRQVKEEPCSSAYIITDKDDNQVTAFYGGPHDSQYVKKLNSLPKSDRYLAIVSPDKKKRVVEYIQFYKKKGIPYIFDPGQTIPVFTDKELKYCITGSKAIFGNDYEVALIKKRLKTIESMLLLQTELVVTTKGARGSVVFSREGKYIIPAVKAKKVIDPTGAGDAYRAGFIKGLIEGWSMEKCGEFASLLAVKAVEKRGTQEHKFKL